METLLSQAFILYSHRTDSSYVPSSAAAQPPAAGGIGGGSGSGASLYLTADKKQGSGVGYHATHSHNIHVTAKSGSRGQ